ncbi:MAG: bifunctional phosphoglucose/phosphomannose isomerase [Candidatus Omnitrophica bacterium]|nr:bifunctional phosphoglucose/phosphomannose isomerase [Candidatus Omnitrophota bacterium]
MKLDNIDMLIADIDKGNMLKILTGLPAQCKEALEIGKRFTIPRSYFKGINKIVFLGVGGSAIGADLIRDYLLDEIEVPVVVNRNYTLPGFVDRATLLFACSYSGDTEETLSAYKEGIKRKSRIIALTSGGSLKKIAGKDGVPCVIIPGGLPPRGALGYSSIPILALLSKAGLIEEKDANIRKASGVMARMCKEELSPGINTAKNIAKSIAIKIYHKIPVLYGASDHTDVAVTRWRGQIAENSKSLSSSHLFPEMNHNEIVGWEYPKRLLKELIVILLRDAQDNPRVQKRMDITGGMIKKDSGGLIEVRSRGNDLLTRLFSLIYIGDFVSFYLALLNRVDPTPVERIKYLKKELVK